MESKTLIKKNLSSVVIISLIVISLVVSSVLFFAGRKGSRRVFVFPSVEKGRYVVENRILGTNPEKSDVEFYIDELLLGSGLERTKKLFTAGTKVISCFERDGTLYLDLSRDLLKMGDNVVEIKKGIELLELNIKKNFKGINDIKLFVDGIYAFEYTKSFTEEQ